MKSYITTIEELKGKPKSELNVIFRNAVEAVASDKVSPLEREAAKRTVDNVRKNLRGYCRFASILVIYYYTDVATITL